MKLPATNFVYLQDHDEQLVRLGMLAERYFADDPNTCLLKLRQLSELLAQLVATQVGLYVSPEETQYDLLRRLQDNSILPREIARMFSEVRRAGNEANHEIAGDHSKALSILKICWQLGLWFHRTFKDAAYKSGPFIPPVPPKDESAELKEELGTLQQTLESFQALHQETSQRLETTEAQLKTTKDEQTFWEQMALETEQAKAALEQKLAQQQQVATTLPTTAFNAYVDAATKAASAVYLDEADTRKLIDEQLKQVGWEAHSQTLTYAKGARPEKGKNRAIAEWPTSSGPADYVLFAGLTPLATVEAKRNNVDVSAALQQAKRYSRTFRMTDPKVSDMVAPTGGPWGEYQIPFTFSSNGRAYLKQLETKSGIWFCDVRRPKNLGRPLDGWHTPEGLATLLKRDEQKADEQLAQEAFNYGFQLRPYQQQAIRAVEAGIMQGLRELLLAMATGTGKTKTCIALIYRLLKTQRFRRILFLVDRSALGEQAANAFKDTRMENLQSFADIFGIKELEDQSPDTETAVHIATIQGMVQRVLYPSADTAPPSVDQYDCIIIDECHRGYLLDRELSETELGFRGFDDYVSKYRRVLEYFDAVKIGLTATPALHTTQIFGAPIFTYAYREAVIDGYLVDHEPPIQIQTELSQNGMVWKKGEAVKVYDPKENQIKLFNTPDELTLEVEAFNRKVITESFNKVVCDYLAKELDPNGNQKTLIFCVTDNHADLVVKLLKDAFAHHYGSVADDAVIKITGSADKPLQLIRRYKNERFPTVAVTVDLLTTGIDVPEICNLVFLRRVNSRILFDQMLGRATRLCDDIGKESFRVFDAVQIYEALKDVTAMQPVVVNPNITFSQLIGELTNVSEEDEQSLVRDQFLAKFQAKKRHLSEKTRQDFETKAGMSPDAFVKHLKGLSLQDISDWFRQNPELGEILDHKGEGGGVQIIISDHPDNLLSVERGYGKVKKPQDYLNEFTSFIRSNSNTLPALMTVLTRPKELTRKQLRELALELDRAGFTETNLEIAWRELTNQDIAARIVGFIRQAATGDPLLPYEERVDKALKTILASKPWTTPQRQWLQKIAAQTKANVIVDREVIDDPDMVFRREGGGFSRLDRMFEGQLQSVLETFNESLWN
jgi:type I restriction enzyme, R subunit